MWAFDSIKNKYSLNHRKSCMKHFCVSLRKHAADIINFDKKKMLPLTGKELKLHQDATQCYICRKNFTKKLAEDKNHQAKI